MGNWNSNDLEVVAWMKNFDLHDIIHSRHKEEHPPPTCKRSSSSPLNAIFVPTQVNVGEGYIYHTISLKVTIEVYGVIYHSNSYWDTTCTTQHTLKQED